MKTVKHPKKAEWYARNRLERLTKRHEYLADMAIAEAAARFEEAKANLKDAYEWYAAEYDRVQKASMYWANPASHIRRAA
jgi:hypothetical protein